MGDMQVLALAGKQYAFYLPDGGSTTLNVTAATGDLQARRIDMDLAAWSPEGAVRANRIARCTESLTPLAR